MFRASKGESCGGNILRGEMQRSSDEHGLDQRTQVEAVRSKPRF